MEDLHDKIVSALEDSSMPANDQPIAEDTAVSPSEPVGDDISTDVEVSPSPEPEAVTAPSKGSSEAPAPVAKKAAPVDEFEKMFGIPAIGPHGRENRIPHSRVKSMVEKAVSKAKQDFESEHKPKFSELETKHKEYETKVQQYEAHLGKVREFEEVMVNKPDQFLKMLSALPAYSEFFQAVRVAFEQAQNGGQSLVDEEIPADMPQPDHRLDDGTMVYTMKGLQARDAWNRAKAAAQAREETLAEVERRFGPIEREYQTQQRIQAVIPQIRQQVDEARTWPQFKENEEEITKVLQANPRISLEGAYRQVVFPRLTADRNKIREEVLREVKQAPRSTAAPAGSVKATPANPANMTLNDKISEELKRLKQ